MPACITLVGFCPRWSSGDVITHGTPRGHEVNPSSNRDAHNVGVPGDVYAFGQPIAWASGVDPEPNMSPTVPGGGSRSLSAERVDTLRRLDILYDRDERGEFLLHACTRTALRFSAGSTWWPAEPCCYCRRRSHSRELWPLAAASTSWVYCWSAPAGARRGRDRAELLENREERGPVRPSPWRHLVAGSTGLVPPRPSRRRSDRRTGVSLILRSSEEGDSRRVGKNCFHRAWRHGTSHGEESSPRRTFCRGVQPHFTTATRTGGTRSNRSRFIERCGRARRCSYRS